MKRHTALLIVAAFLALRPSPAPCRRQGPARTDLYGDRLPPGAVARLGTHRLSHRTYVNSVAFSPDGKVIARSLRGWAIRDAVAEALSKRSSPPATQPRVDDNGSSGDDAARREGEAVDADGKPVGGAQVVPASVSRNARRTALHLGNPGLMVGHWRAGTAEDNTCRTQSIHRAGR